MEQEKLNNILAPQSEPTVSSSFRTAFGEYKENFSFLGLVYLPLAALTVFGIFIPGIAGAALTFIPGILSAIVTPGFISAISKNFYPETISPYGKLKILYKDGLKYIIPVVWIGILTGLCVFFGIILFVLPGIWLSVVLGYSIYALIFDGKRGLEALAYSYIYAKNNFWFIIKRTILLGIGFSVVAGVISGFFPPEKKLISELSGDQSFAVTAEVRNSKYYKVFFGEDDPFTYVRQPGDEALSAIFNNVFAIPFAMFFVVGVFNLLKKKNAYLVTEEEVTKTKKKIGVLVWLGILLPIIIFTGLIAIFGGTAILSLQQLLP